jgi:hypothetical protein
MPVTLPPLNLSGGHAGPSEAAASAYGTSMFGGSFIANMGGTQNATATSSATTPSTSDGAWRNDAPAQLAGMGTVPMVVLGLVALGLILRKRKG